MAIYHFSGTVLSRSQGRSAIACSAYRAGARLQDDYYGKCHDYTQKRDVVHTEIFLPEGAPLWMSDREKLWNAVESGEKRKDAQLAREFNVALPRELTIEQNIVLARAFVQSAFVEKGMVADLCIHNDRMATGERQPHLHVMLTLREVTANGFGPKVREWNGKAYLLQWREAWAETANYYLAFHGYDRRIDHRTLAAQGIDLEPQYKIGTTHGQDQRARFLDHQRIARENGERLYADPTVALQALTRQQSTFTRVDIAKFLHRHTENAEQFQRVYAKVNASEEIVILGHDANQRERLTTREMLGIEQGMISGAEVLATRYGHGVPERAKQRILTGYGTFSVEQRLAFTNLTNPGDLKLVRGYAGSGKSYMLGAARQAWEGEGYRVLGATLSGIAAENLAGSSGIESRTLASLFYYWDRGELLLEAGDVLVIDEAGLIGSRQMARVIQESQARGAKVVLVGDPQQLQAIEAGAAFRSITDRHRAVELTEIRRQQATWQQVATQALAKGEVAEAIQAYAQRDHVHVFETPEAAKTQLVHLWYEAGRSDPDKTQIMLAYTREEVRSLNETARALRHKNAELGIGHRIDTVRGAKEFSAHDRIYFLKNDRGLGVKNGTLGTIEAIRGSFLVVKLDPEGDGSDRHLTVDVSRYNDLDYGYAATFHKSQGVTVDRAYVLATPWMDSHSAYVGLTRHRERCDVFYSQTVFKDTQALAAQLGRDRAKDTSLDYAVASPERGDFQTHRTAAGDFRQSQEKTMDSSRVQTALDLALFRRQFEAKNPSLAASIQQTVRSSVSTDLEKRILEATQHFKQLEAAFEKSGTRSTRVHLETYAAKLRQDKAIFAYLNQHQPDFGKHIDTLSQRHAMRRDLDIEH